MRSSLIRLGLMEKDAYTCTCYMKRGGKYTGDGRGAVLVGIFGSGLRQLRTGGKL